MGGDPVPLDISVGADIPWSATAPRGVDYFKVLHQILNEEPAREQDKVWIAMLEPPGIELGKAFEPTDRQATLLAKGAALGELMQRNIQFNPRFAEPYWEGTHWYNSFDFSLEQSTKTKVELDERALWFYEAVTSTQGMVNPAVGAGQVYMTAKRDLNGDLLRTDKTYKLHVPAEVPVGWFVYFRLYAPLEPWFDKSWSLPDFEPVSG